MLIWTIKHCEGLEVRVMAGLVRHPLIFLTLTFLLPMTQLSELHMSVFVLMLFRTMMIDDLRTGKA